MPPLLSMGRRRESPQHLFRVRSPLFIYHPYWTSFSPHRVTTAKCNQANGTRKEVVPEINFSTSEVPFHAPVFGEIPEVVLEHKYQFLQTLQGTGLLTVMTGDGVNDADCSITME